MSLDQRNHVKVLYDYSYPDEHGTVEIKAGEVYTLLEKTNSEWWHVCDKDKKDPLEEEDGIFVPARYVKELNDVDKALSSLDNVLGEEGDQGDYGNITVGQSDASGASSQQESQSGFTTSTDSGRPPSEHNGMGKTSYDDEADYVNLEQYRAEANIIPPSDVKQTAPSINANEGDYANYSYQHHHSEQGLQLKDGTFVRVLVDGLPWDVYEDHATQRKFFHNRETGELTWKPPRKDKPSSPVERSPHGQEHPLQKKNQEPVSSLPVLSLETLAEQPADHADQIYDKKEEGSDVFFINKSTKEKWQQLVDEAGRQYFHRIGSNDTQWELPLGSSIRSKSESQEHSPRNGETMREGGGATSHTMSLTRQSKSKSMYGKIEMTPQDQGGLKSDTLPPNFAPGGGVGPFCFSCY